MIKHCRSDNKSATSCPAQADNSPETVDKAP